MTYDTVYQASLNAHLTALEIELEAVKWLANRQRLSLSDAGIREQELKIRIKAVMKTLEKDES